MLKEALVLTLKMIILPDSQIWGSLLAATKVNRNCWKMGCEQGYALPFVNYCFWVFIILLPVTFQVHEVNSPNQLAGWRIGGGDPCGGSWNGVTCEGSAVVFMYGNNIAQM